jgi:hypothetical protein
MLHYKACARTRKQKAADIALMIFGTLAAAFTTIQTIKVGNKMRVLMHYVSTDNRSPCS